MTREEVLKTYEVESGIIKSPGKFEGEPIYVPYFWDLALEGEADVSEENADGDLIDSFDIRPEDVAEFPELKGATRITLMEDNSGFGFSHLI